MLSDVGQILSGLSLATALYGAAAALLGIRARDGRWIESARRATYAVAALLGGALLLLLAAFLSDHFAIRYVAQHASTAMPLYLKVSAIWAGQEGSLLLWGFLQGLFAALAIGRPSARARPLVPWATVFLNVITAFFVAVMVLLSNPFAVLPQVPPDGQGLNPLLRHPGMIFHPPALYVGYVGLAVPFAFALAALVTRRIQGWTRAVHTWILVAWLGLGLGLLLGMRWAYDVLGWGGYWGWDPVENAGLLPWFTTTALLHSAVMQEERRGFRIWTMALVVASFLLVLFGTFATRSGVIQSVHAYVRSNLGTYFLGAIGATLVGSVGLIYARRQSLVGSDPTSDLLSRDGMFFLTLTLLTTLTLSVLVGSLLPTITDRLSGQRFEAGPAWFDRVTGPQFAALILVMGVCPLLGRAGAALKGLQQRVGIILIGAVGVPGVLAAAGFTQVVPLLGFAVVGLAGATTLAEWIDGSLRYRRRRDTGFWEAAWTLLRQRRRTYGGYLVHIGVILMAIGVVGSRAYEFERELSLSAQEPTQVGAYTLTYEELTQEPQADSTSISAIISVARGGREVATLKPTLNHYAAIGQSVRVPALRPGLREDLYLILGGWSDNGDAVTIRMVVNPLINFLWLGGLVFLAGGGFALWPAGGNRTRNLIALLVGLALLVGAGWAMWGIPHGVVRSGSGRPKVGEPAPDFELTLLDGSSTSLADLRGEIVMVNFWSTQCPICREKMPELQRLWETYRARDVTFVGISTGDERAAVERAVDDFGTTFPIGLDPGGQITQRYGVTGVPETFIVDREGALAFFYVGAVSNESLVVQLDRLLEGP